MIFAALLATGIAAKGIAVYRERAGGEVLKYFDIDPADFGAAQFQHAETEAYGRGVLGKGVSPAERMAQVRSIHTRIAKNG
ncbi:MAG: hypothetical protein BWY09_02806 [Candidatus Hydrogenedentes bacterium ADurb.Bin179]|nr:MAG: hypothetical protein BWY09_02806 [Candidatus Hydrogenedentes bacterium ADurb.Bin179]